MQPFAVWFSAALVLGIAELLTGTFVLLVMAIAAVGGGVAARLGVGMPGQLVVAAVIGVVGCAVVARLHDRRPRLPADENPDVNSDIGNAVQVDSWAGRCARVSYRGSQWDVEYLGDEPPGPGKYIIRRVAGSKLLVGPDDVQGG
ncbi:MAG: NfeD family protein [Armatimonadetes bacterium]|nr:NfeD family protein [Armatimonadota bacterium]